MDFQYDYQKTTHNLSLTQIDDHRFKAVIGEREFEFSATQQTDGAWLLTINNQRVLAYVASDGELHYVHVNGNTVTLTAVNERTKRRKQSGSVGDLTAQMPGQVVDVLVSNGDTVSSGQTLVILEAMKMEIRVTALADGVIQDVYVAQGDVVQRGQRLVEVTAN
jgi:biotin carboxyl carrier protein